MKMNLLKNCAICRKDGTNSILVCPNGHYGHAICYSEWYMEGNMCPKCGIDVNATGYWKKFKSIKKDYIITELYEEISKITSMRERTEFVLEKMLGLSSSNDKIPVLAGNHAVINEKEGEEATEDQKREANFNDYKKIYVPSCTYAMRALGVSEERLIWSKNNKMTEFKFMEDLNMYGKRHGFVYEDRWVLEEIKESKDYDPYLHIHEAFMLGTFWPGLYCKISKYETINSYIKRTKLNREIVEKYF